MVRKCVKALKHKKKCKPTFNVTKQKIDDDR